MAANDSTSIVEQSNSSKKSRYEEDYSPTQDKNNHSKDIMMMMSAAEVDESSRKGDIPQPNDIIEINAGGKFTISTNRSTLSIAEGSMFSSMFSGRWDDGLTCDNQGRIFIDEDPELIEIIVNFFREKKRQSNPSKPLVFDSLPCIPEIKRRSFLSLIDYYGLSNFFFGSSFGGVLSFPVPVSDVFLPRGSNMIVDKTNNKIQLTKNDEGYGPDFVACTPPLDVYGDCGVSWKVTVDSLGSHCFLFMGIIQKLDPEPRSYDDPTSYGWSTSNNVYEKGTITGVRNAGVSIDGCVVYFHFNTKKLTMYNVELKKAFVIDIDHDDAAKTYIHFNMYDFGVKVTLEALSNEEFSILLDNV